MAAGRSATTSDPASDESSAHRLLERALFLEQTGRKGEALEVAGRLVALRPGWAAGWALAAHLRACHGEHEIAVALGRQALAIDPEDPQTRYNLGVSLHALDRLEEATQAYRDVLRRQQRHRGARVNLGACLRLLGRSDEALRVWQEGVALDPDCSELRFNLACATIQRGAWQEAWPGYEERWNVHADPEPVIAGRLPRWDGSRLDGALVVASEQGLGDTLQFVRLLPRIADRCRRILMACPRRLHRLLSGSLASEVVLLGDGVDASAAEAWISLLSLPGLLDLDPTSVGADAPYLRAEAALVSAWRRRLDDELPSLPGELRIGLVWQGNPYAPADLGRSLRLRALARLADIPGVRLVSLQKGHGREQLLDPPAGFTALDLGAELDCGEDAFVDTAAVLQTLDLLITTDTAVAHLAGALGRPVWILLKHVPDWRWPIESGRTAWYPSMRLFHQPRPGDWDGAVERVVAALRELVDLRRGFKPEEGRPASLQDVLAAHRAGRLAEAIDGYRSLLAFDCDRPELLHLLAVARYASGRNQEESARKSLPLAERAAELAPRDADVHANLGLLFKAAGRPREAETTLRHALALTDGNHDAANRNLVNLLLEQGRAEAAVVVAERGCAAKPTADHLATLARALESAGRREAALSSWKKAVELEPDRPEFWVGLGSLLALLGEARDGAACFERALALDPSHADALTNLGVLERQAGRPELAAWLHCCAVDSRSDHVTAWTNLGATLLELGRLEDGERALRNAIRTRPDHAPAHMALGMALLLQGCFAEGLAEYEWRIRAMAPAQAASDRPKASWDGAAAEGLSFLLLTEQGFGDAIHFVRYASVLKARGARSVVLGCRAPLARLLARAAGIDRVLIEGQTIPPVDVTAHVMSLPFLLGTRLDSIPASVPYVEAEPELVTLWAERLAQKPGLRVGLVWQGNPDPKVDHGRSLSLSQLAPLASHPGVRLIALQKGAGREQIDQVGPRFPVETLEPEPDSGSDAFVDTAAIMMNLDLVITTDTAAAHLAGALGRPVWVMLRHPPEWRWLLDRETSPWYPTMRLFRQDPSSGDRDPWSPVVARVARELRRLAEGDRSALVPASGSTSEGHPADGRQAAVTPDPDALFRDALAAHRANELEVAQRRYGRLLCLARDHAEALHMLGVCALQAGRAHRAAFLLARARAAGLATPEHASNFALALKGTGRRTEAERELRAAIEARPHFTEARINLANLLSETDRADAASNLLEPVLSTSNTAAAWRAFGNALHRSGDPVRAVAAFERARGLAPEDPEIRLDLAHALLATGEIRKGFAEYEWRWRSRSMKPRSWTVPSWDGDLFRDRTLLVHGEQGLGDHMMFVRFLPLVAARGGTVLLEIRAELHALLRTALSSCPNIELVVQGAALPAFDMEVALESVPQRLGVDLADIPASVPYLHAEPERVARWRARLGRPPLMQVGLVWQGNPNAQADHGRSMPLELLEPVLAVPGASFVALQKEHGLEQLAGLAARYPICHPGPDYDDGPDAFLDAAAILENLDLVVTTDTALAHLAGALGRPAWLLLKHAPDWRWLTGRDDSPWYPTLRLYRQPRTGDWASVVQVVARDLRRLVAARRAAAVGST